MSVCVWLFVLMYVCLDVIVHMYVCLCVIVHMYVCVCVVVRTYVCMSGCDCSYVCMWVCTSLMYIHSTHHLVQESEVTLDFAAQVILADDETIDMTGRAKRN